ncbi:MAG: prepilin-type N-terminal cleavage/methylation domain-containing protein [Pirellulaceae bacterium]
MNRFNIGHRKHQGVTLIEALIALLVLSIGLVGLGALMVTSLKNVHSSAHYSVASAIVLDFEEVIWSELAQASATAAAGTTPAALDANGCLSDNTITALATSLTTQWRSGSAGQDAWTDAQRFQLPGITIAAGDTATVQAVDAENNARGVHWKTIETTVTWNEDRFAEGDGGETYNAEITVVCRPTFL